MVGDAPREAETFQAAMSRRADLPRPSGDRVMRWLLSRGEQYQTSPGAQPTVRSPLRHLVRSPAGQTS